MIREIICKQFDGGARIIEAAGLSSDEKPTEGIVTGSTFREVDTGAEFAFDEVTGMWFNQAPGRTSIAGAAVTLGDALTYDGTEQTQGVASVKIGSTTLTPTTDYVVINNKAILPGSYTLHIVGVGSYAGVLPEAFAVAKGAGSVSASPDTLTLTEGGEAGESTLTVTGDGAVSVASGDDTVATETLEGNTVTVTPVGAGSATVTVTLAATALYYGATETIAVTVEAAEDDQQDDTPDDQGGD